MKRTPRSLQGRFDEKYVPDPTTGCWLWTAGADSRGYGSIAIGVLNGGGRRHELAHRMSWLLHRGPIPDGLQVLHRCDTPACVNPDHLFLGTHVDNMRDRQEKGRTRPNAKLTASEVRIARVLLARGWMQKTVAESLGVSAATISRINSGTIWKGVQP